MSHFQDGGHGVISCRKVLPSGECTRSICPARMQQRPPVPDAQDIRNLLLQLLRLRTTSQYIKYMYLYDLAKNRFQPSIVFGEVVKSDRDEIWQHCSSNKYASIDWDGLSIWRYTFKMATHCYYSCCILQSTCNHVTTFWIGESRKRLNSGTLSKISFTVLKV